MESSNRRRIALASLIVIVTGATGGLFAFYNHFLPESVAEIGQALPSLTLQDMDGRPVNIDSYRGKPLLVSFIEVNCHHCQNQLSVFETLHREISDGNLTLLAISTSSVEKTAVFFQEHPISFPTWIDANRNLYKKLGVFNVPALFFLDETGVLRYKAVGYQSTDAVSGIIDSLFLRERTSQE